MAWRSLWRINTSDSSTVNLFKPCQPTPAPNLLCRPRTTMPQSSPRSSGVV